MQFYSTFLMCTWHTVNKCLLICSVVTVIKNGTLCSLLKPFGLGLLNEVSLHNLMPTSKENMNKIM